MNTSCPNCGQEQVQGSARCPKCNYNGLNIGIETPTKLILKDLLTDKVNNNNNGGDKMPEISRPQETQYLKASFIIERKISELKITSEPDWIDTEFKGKKDKKIQCEVQYSGQTSSDPNIWTMNKSSSIALFDKHGKDTKTWMGKAIPITIDGEGEMKSIKVDKIRLG